MSDPRCKCSMAISVLGDGCQYCQPQEYIERLVEQHDDELSDFRQQLEAVEAERDEALARVASGRALCDIAARVITEQADSLKDCHTLNGAWPEEEVEAKSEYEYLAALGKRCWDFAKAEKAGGE